MSTIEFEDGAICGVKLVKPAVFTDSRGYFTETHHTAKYAEMGLDRTFVQDNYSFSKRNVLRGLHYQRHHPQGKLVFAVSGKILDVAVDIRRGSPTFGKWESYILSVENHHQLFVPEGCAHGFVVLSDEATVYYKCTDIYRSSDDRGLRWSDPDLAVDWKGVEPVLSDKDAALPLFRELPEDELPEFKA